MDERQKKKREARMAWPFVMYFGALIVVIGLLIGLIGLGIIPLNLPILLSTGTILVGMFFVALSLVLKSNPDAVADEA
jgi:hypothetical protein